MNTARTHTGWYVAECHGGDAARTVRLGRTLAPTRRLALRWLRRQARRFADALDPDPYTPWIPARALQSFSGVTQGVGGGVTPGVGGGGVPGIGSGVTPGIGSAGAPGIGAGGAPGGVHGVMPGRVFACVPDIPTELRSWAGSFREHDYALLRLADGLPYEFVARDHTSWYGLVMRPLTPARPVGPPHPPTPRP
ncbi:hypothetical protein [Streptomyces sp. NPDC101181]|uniref:hypothetical protein n=1 Tax=Streptomyces sp. NPDC101181 TaxID=3366125 RepID=UPI00382C276D